MQKTTQRSIAKILDAYRDYLLSKVSKVRILGEAEERELKDVFVELSIVEQRTRQQHTEFLGMMDSAMRKRFDPFADEDIDTKLETSEPREKETKRRVKPDELLRHRTKAIVTGAPGCGKTTLLKYLALQSQEKEKRLAVWLELKGIDKPLFAQAEKAAAQAGNLILQELWLRHLKTQLSLSDAEIKLLRQHWQEMFKANDIAVLLDGFDELQDDAIERSLNKCVREFASAAHDNTLLISTRPYAQHRLGKERLQELEIEPLNQRQIEAFLNCYYPNDAAIKSLLKNLRERSSLRELLHVPLLLGVILRLHRENRFTNERLEFYEAIIADLVHELDRSKSVIRQFKINDERLRSDFLKFLAFERLLRDPLGEGEQEANRIIFSYDLLKEKAGTFLAQERLSHNPRDLADDALATPLLREVGADAFAFTHLTLQEYLAARAFAAFYKSNEFAGLKIFCRAYHNPTIVEMEVLPMMLGATTGADKLNIEIERWPESLTYTNLRLRARGLFCAPVINRQLLVTLTEHLLRFFGPRAVRRPPYWVAILSGFSGASGPSLEFITSHISPLLQHDNNHVRWSAMNALGLLCGEHAINALLEVLKHEDRVMRWKAMEALGQTGTEQAIPVLIKILENESAYDFRRTLQEDRDTARSAAMALRQIGTEEAITALLTASKAKNRFVRERAATELGQIDDARAITALFAALQDTDPFVRLKAAVGLRRIDEEHATVTLIEILRSGEVSASEQAATALGQLGTERAVAPLFDALKENKNTSTRGSAAEALGLAVGERAVPALIDALKDKAHYVCERAAAALERIGGDQAIPALFEALQDEHMAVRVRAASALGHHGGAPVITFLIRVVQSDFGLERWTAAGALARIMGERAVPIFLEAMKITDSVFTRMLTLKPEKMKEGLFLAYWARGAIISALGQVGGEQAVVALLEILSGDDDGAHGRAAWALERISDKTLAGGLLKALSHEKDFVRRGAVQVVGYYVEGEQVLHELARLAAKDRTEKVRCAAGEAHAKYERKLELLGHFITEGTPKPLRDNESREGVLIGEVTKVIFEAGHIFRPTPNNDWGIDGEIEFKNDKGEASGQRVYLQLKSGDSYLRTRKTDDKEIFTIENPRHAEYWQAHAYPVMLVIRNSSGRTRWMDVTEYLRRHGTNVRQIEFQGEPFTPESVKQMRDRFAR